MAFQAFIHSARRQHPEKTILFNAVGNWPIEALAETPLDFLYIEIWQPDVNYYHVAEIVMNAVRRSGGKPVVIALYLPADRPENILTANAVIAACGGSRIELGEETRLLADPYFPKHQAISDSLSAALRRANDFWVRYGAWTLPYTLSEADRQIWADGIFQPEGHDLPDGVWAVQRRHGADTTLALINLTGPGPDARWDVVHAAVEPLTQVPVGVQCAQPPSSVWWICPEQGSGAPQQLDFEFDNAQIRFVIPKLNRTGVILLHE
jgi:dextranase